MVLVVPVNLVTDLYVHSVVVFLSKVMRVSIEVTLVVLSGLQVTLNFDGLHNKLIGERAMLTGKYPCKQRLKPHGWPMQVRCVAKRRTLIS